MKYRLLDFLVEPNTGEGFDLHVFEEKIIDSMPLSEGKKCSSHCFRLNKDSDGIDSAECQKCPRHEVIQGKLVSKVSRIEYPVINGIPRILPSDLLQPLVQNVHNDYVRRFGKQFAKLGHLNYEVENEKKKTVEAFGYQWRTFVDNYDYFKDIMLSFTRPFMDEADYAGKLLLEVGCGSGRPGVASCKMGAEVVGMDISEAVESAYTQSLKLPGFHVVQADAYAPPFRPVFDVVYSVGVLQHIPSPEKALLGISKVVAPTKPLLLWIYGKRELWYQPIEWSRTLTRKMPLNALRIVSIVLAALSELFLLIPYRLMKASSLLSGVAEKIPGRIYAKYPFRENVVGWFDRLVAPVTYYFSEADIRALLEKTGFKDLKVHARKDASASWVIWATRK
ncbi:MAG: class I SAM-dependent methyltransferase [Hahellaceae bacterium]|nr:class I SAM-dependent methyltransferase [Hahellaceae bacterium]